MKQFMLNGNTVTEPTCESVTLSSLLVYIKCRQEYEYKLRLDECNKFGICTDNSDIH